MKIYLVAQTSDEYSNTLHLKDVLNSGGITSFNYSENYKSLAFPTLELAKEYLNTFDGKPAYSDGSGNAKDKLSIFETEMP